MNEPIVQTDSPNLLDEMARLFKAFGQAVVMTAQEVTNLLVLHLDQDTCKHLDMLVEAGLAHHRAEAASMLIAAGIQARRPVFEKINQTGAQIAILKRQLRSTVGGQS